jgi:hypothetical protein
VVRKAFVVMINDDGALPIAGRLLAAVILMTPLSD